MPLHRTKRSRSGTNSEESVIGQSVLTERGRPNSRDRAERQKSKEKTVIAEQRQLVRPPLSSPTSKENAADVAPTSASTSPTRKRRKTPKLPDQDDFSRRLSTSDLTRTRSRLEVRNAPSIRFETTLQPSSPASTATFHNSDSDRDVDEDELIDISEKDTQEILPPKVERIPKKIRDAASQPKKTSTAPKPHPALLYHQERLSGVGAMDPTSGIIKHVRLVNFMCHTVFEKEWNSNLNFITGENGSGKSAILSGIIIGLGARATLTSRTKSVAELVKTGCQFAKIEITLMNHEVLSTEKYGKEIIIQRVLDVRGPTTYKICTGLTPKFRSLRRTELDFILHSLGIIIDNPVAVLNQEAARSFLKTKDPGDKYKFFFEGTSLATFDRMLRETKSNMVDTEGNLARSKEILEDRHKQVQTYKELKTKLDEAEKMEEQIDQLTTEYRWSLVVVEERKRNEVKTELENEDTRRSKLTEALDSIIAKKAELVENSSTSPEEMDALKSKLRQMGKDEQDLQRELVQLSRHANENKAKIKSTSNQLTTISRTLADIEAKVQDMSTRGKAEAELAKKDYEEKFNELQANKEAYEEEFQTLKTEKEQFGHGTEALRNELKELQSQEQELTQRIVRLKDEVRNLENKNSKVNRYAAFGRQMEDLMTKVQSNQRRFKVMPRGPLGACFTVKSEKWVRLIELILTSQIYDFVVENADDQNLLNQLIKQTFLPRGRQSGFNDSFSGGPSRRPSVICNRSAFSALFDTTRTKAKALNHPTILDMIEVENNDVAVLNTLIDACAIEKILLFEKNEVACNLLKDKNNPNFPKNCELGFTLEFFQIRPDPRYRIDAKNQHHRNSYLKCSSALQLRHLKKSIVETEASLQELLPGLESKRREEAIVRQKFNSQDEAFRQIQKKLTDIKMKILTHSKTVSKEPDISSYVEEMQETRADLEVQTEARNQALAALEEITTKISQLKAQKEQTVLSIEGTQAKVAEMKDVMDNYNEKFAQMEAKIRTAKTKVREIQGRCDALKPKLDRLEKSVEERTNEAAEVGERVETNRSPAALQDEVRQYTERIQEAKRLVGDRESIIRKLNKAKEEYRRLRTEYKFWLEIFLLMQSYLNLNIDFYETTVQVIGNVLMTSFQCLIASRGYQGRLLIDHVQKELYYFVCPDGKSNEKTHMVLNCRDTRQIKHYLTEYASGLSGGERSFATICYILSMWQIMECPFFMLDEFDVFMDPYNRKASQNALICHANRFKNYQFFLFTPLDITELKQGSNASVIRMFPPLRKDKESADDGKETDEDGGEDGPAAKRRRGVTANDPIQGTSTGGSTQRQKR